MLTPGNSCRWCMRNCGDLQRIDLFDADAPLEPDDHERLLDLNEALEEFARQQPEKAGLVKLRYFAGLSESEAA